MENLLAQESVNEITTWCHQAMMSKLTTQQWATLLALVLIDDEQSRARLESGKMSQLVISLDNLMWSQPFHMTTHREGCSGADAFKAWLRSDKMSYPTKREFVDGFNYLLGNCYEQIISGHDEYNWLLKQMVMFCWDGFSISFNPELVEKILQEEKVSDWVKAALIDFYSDGKNRSMSFHLSLSISTILKLRELPNDNNEIGLFHRRLNSIKVR